MIDRIFTNEAWIYSFPNVEAVAEVCGVSDHSLLIVSINEEVKRGAKPFKFFDFWMRNCNFKNIFSTV